MSNKSKTCLKIKIIAILYRSSMTDNCIESKLFNNSLYFKNKKVNKMLLTLKYFDFFKSVCRID